MKFELFIGKIHLLIDSELKPILKPEVLQFRKPLLNLNEYNSYFVEIKNVTTIFIPNGVPDMEYNSLMLYDDIRYYRNQDIKNDEIAPQGVFAKSQKNGNHITVEYLESSNQWNQYTFSIMNLIHLETILLETGAIILHSCYLEHKGNAILFTAPSGTGKTTQAQKWTRLFGSRIINGDLSLIYLDDSFEKNPLATGFIYHGSAPECSNETFQIKAIVVLSQAKDNKAIEIKGAKAMAVLLSEMFINTWDDEQIKKAMDLVSRIIEKTRIIHFDCNIDDISAKILKDYIFGEDNGSIYC